MKRDNEQLPVAALLPSVSLFSRMKNCNCLCVLICNCNGTLQNAHLHLLMFAMKFRDKSLI